MSKPLSAFAGKALYLDTSVLTFDEMAYRMLLALMRDRYGSSPLDHLRDHQVVVGSNPITRSDQV